MKLQKLIFIIILITLTIIVLSKSVLAVTIGDYEFDTDDSGANTSAVQRISNKVLGVIQWVSILLGVIVIAVIGIKFMMGSVEEKSQYKKSMTPLVIGIIVVMGTTTITKTLFNLFNATLSEQQSLKNSYESMDCKRTIYKTLIEYKKESITEDEYNKLNNIITNLHNDLLTPSTIVANYNGIGDSIGELMEPNYDWDLYDDLTDEFDIDMLHEFAITLDDYDESCWMIILKSINYINCEGDMVKSEIFLKFSN